MSHANADCIAATAALNDFVKNAVTCEEERYRRWVDGHYKPHCSDLIAEVTTELPIRTKRLEELLQDAKARFTEAGCDVRAVLGEADEVRASVRRLLTWGATVSPGAAPVPTREGLEATIRYAREAVERLTSVWPAETAASTPERRLTFDDDTLTVVLDGKRHKIDDSQAYAVYKSIAQRDTPTITKRGIRSRVRGVRGQKTIPRLLGALPRVLHQTVQVSTKGYWLVLPKSRERDQS
jgi:hypothetical protein